ncbi:hypothetical protein MMC30_004702 [Trapelia coarctata]|nr:hypothetical protein [Trapelia coarctata]
MTVIPSIIPSYASACSSAVRYSSECSCIGVTQVTTTVAAPSTTTAITVTVAAVATATTTSTLTQSIKATVVLTATKDITNTLTATETRSIPITIIATVTVTAPAAPLCMQLYLTSYNGYGSVQGGIIAFNSGNTVAPTGFILYPDGRLTSDPDNKQAYIPNSFSGNPSQIMFRSAGMPNDGSDQVKCTSNGSTLQCVTGQYPTVISYYDNTDYNPNTAYIYLYLPPGNGCVGIGVQFTNTAHPCPPLAAF